uniref:CDP-diacylglycerol--inositol 3-phosphatidyltransferase n=1 Tax=Denticeps clupeoides TaxID=299321 RepID=A0AAY4DKP2_9TELE
MKLEVLFYIPNVIGYVRILLLLAAWIAFNTPEVFILAYVLFVILDGVDGWAARWFDQSSKFGAWLDVVIDNTGRAMVWSMLFKWGWLVSSVEWCVFVCNHSARGARWKNSFTKGPYWVRAIMANGFRTPPGLLTIAGLHVLPLWLYGGRHGMLCVPEWFEALGLAVLVGGRLLCLLVEMWCMWSHVQYLTENEAEEA